MRVVCAPLRRLPRPRAGELQVVLYGYADRAGRGEAGASLLETIKKLKLQPADRAWDLLSLALAVNAADLAVQRSSSPDGWTRDLELQVAVCDPDFWNGQRELVERQLKFLTTDIWRVSFVGDGLLPAPPRPATVPTEDSVALLSGGMDSLVGALDLTGRDGLRPFAASQVAIGDKQIQADFARRIGNCLRHLQLNHNINAPDETERSQRARSLIFLAYGVLAATTLDRHSDGQTVPLYVSENGFISINPPLTAARIGSLSTRTTNPVFIRLFQELLNIAGLRVRVENPYQLHTKGEMLAQCVDQPFLQRHAHLATSCSRYGRYNYTHCGRCVPCIVRRAAFHHWGHRDRTDYKFRDLSRDNDDNARFDDVRSAAMAVLQVRSDGLDSWLGAAISSTFLGDISPYRATVERGLAEIGAFLDDVGVL